MTLGEKGKLEATASGGEEKSKDALFTRGEEAMVSKETASGEVRVVDEGGEEREVGKPEVAETKEEVEGEGEGVNFRTSQYKSTSSY